MRLLRPSARFVAIGSITLLALACEDPEVVKPPTSTGTGGEGGSGVTSTAATFSNSVSSSTASGTGGSDPCAGVNCDPDAHCDPQSGSCVLNTCADLNCGATEICVIDQNGGAICQDISCTQDVDCPASQYCNGTICVDDVCTPGTATCVGNDLFECPPNGSAAMPKYTCGSTSYFMSMCVDPGMGDATCPCEDDWDCPANTVCEVGNCVGTGVAPTCTLPPIPFANALPVNEIQWGGTGTAQKDALGSPFPQSSQVSVVPIVINLDDDNGDGLIDELDFPEIVFTSYCASDISANGAVRAIHGGGPNKGKDYFATLGALTWHEGDAMPAYACANGTANSTGNLAAGDLDGDGVPEIVVPTETAGLVILDNTGNVITTSANNVFPAGFNDPSITLANVDGAGFAEIVVGNVVFTLAHDMNNKLVIQDRFLGNLMTGRNGQGPISCVANVTGDSKQEIVAGSTVYRMPMPPAGVTKIADCAVGDTSNFCTGKLDVVWDAQTVNGTTLVPTARRDGFCAVADVLGTDEATAPSPTNPLDGNAEVVLVDAGFISIFNGTTGVLRRSIALTGGGNGGAPNVDDFDGDGFPEIGTAMGARYLMIDLQDPTAACPAWPNAFTDGTPGLQGNPARNPGGACAMDSDCAAGAKCANATCVCLHNGWQRVTEDDSSAVTSSSVFDFNGDGAAEVVYNDECFFRVYDGAAGGVLFKQNSPSRTRTENPAIADVDNDGNAEIVFASNNEVSFCSSGVNFPNGIAVWGDANDAWVSARRIWNEHAYHVTNVLEGGGVPVQEPESWKDYNGRRYDTYRSNPRSFGVAPDLTISHMQISSPGVTCGQLSTVVDVTVQIDNIGDQRVGPGVVVTFYGTWASPALMEPLYADAMMTPLTATIQTSIEPGGSILVTVSYDASHNAPNVLPDSVRAVVDEVNQEHECVETNNELTNPVDPGSQKADLVLTLGAVDQTACPDPTVVTTLTNNGSLAASNIVVRYYAGDPNQGGTAIHEEIVPGPLAAMGGTTTFTVTLPAFPPNLSILVYGVADPDDAIPECNDANNKDAADSTLLCSTVM